MGYANRISNAIFYFIRLSVRWIHIKKKINDIELYIEKYGSGKPIVFSYGWLDDCSIWSSQIDAFAKNNTKIIYDHRGHGLSDKPKGDYSIKELSDDLYSLIEELRLEKTIIVGFSLGGMVALRFAIEHPDRIIKLVLVGTTAKMALTMHIIRILKYILPYKTIARIVCKRKFYKPSKQIIEDALSRAMKVDRYVAYKCLNEFTKNYDIRDMISLIKVPTLIVVGEKDKLNLKASKYLNRKIKNSELRIVSGSGHTVMVEKPDEFNHIVGNFIRK